MMYNNNVPNTDGFPSGQRERTVNPLSQTTMVRIHPRPPTERGRHSLPLSVGGHIIMDSKPVKKTRSVFRAGFSSQSEAAPRGAQAAKLDVRKPNPSPSTRKKHLRMQVLFSTMRSACAERDAHFVRDVCFASDVYDHFSFHCEHPPF